MDKLLDVCCVLDGLGFGGQLDVLEHLQLSQANASLWLVLCHVGRDCDVFLVVLFLCVPGFVVPVPAV